MRHFDVLLNEFILDGMGLVIIDFRWMFHQMYCNNTSLHLKDDVISRATTLFQIRLWVLFIILKLLLCLLSKGWQMPSTLWQAHFLHFNRWQVHFFTFWQMANTFFTFWQMASTFYGGHSIPKLVTPLGNFKAICSLIT